MCKHFSLALSNLSWKKLLFSDYWEVFSVSVMTKLFTYSLGGGKIYMLLIIDLFFKMPKEVVVSDEHFIKTWRGIIYNSFSLHPGFKFSVFPLKIFRGKSLTWIILVSLSPLHCLTAGTTTTICCVQDCFNSWVSQLCIRLRSLGRI